MQWMTEDCTSRANTGWRKKMWWDELGGKYFNWKKYLYRYLNNILLYSRGHKYQ